MSRATHSQQAASVVPSWLQHLLARLAASDDARACAELSGRVLEQPLPGTRYRSVVGAVPFAAAIEASGIAPELHAFARTRRPELLAIAWTWLALEEGGRFALIVPESVLEGDTQAHRALRRRLIEDNALQAVIGLRAGLFRPRTRAAILVGGKGERAERIWFGELDSERAGAELLARWPLPREAPGASLHVRREDIRPPAYALGIARYRNAQATTEPPDPQRLLHEIATLEAEILQGIRELVGMLA